eukprot:1186149-Prorocentrum_minimum.AAC.4
MRIDRRAHPAVPLGERGARAGGGGALRRGGTPGGGAGGGAGQSRSGAGAVRPMAGQGAGAHGGEGRGGQRAPRPCRRHAGACSPLALPPLRRGGCTTSPLHPRLVAPEGVNVGQVASERRFARDVFDDRGGGVGRGLRREGASLSRRRVVGEWSEKRSGINEDAERRMRAQGAQGAGGAALAGSSGGSSGAEVAAFLREEGAAAFPRGDGFPQGTIEEAARVHTSVPPPAWGAEGTSGAEAAPKTAPPKREAGAGGWMAADEVKRLRAELEVQRAEQQVHRKAEEVRFLTPPRSRPAPPRAAIWRRNFGFATKARLRVRLAALATESARLDSGARLPGCLAAGLGQRSTETGAVVDDVHLVLYCTVHLRVRAFSGGPRVEGIRSYHVTSARARSGKAVCTLLPLWRSPTTDR